MRKIAAYAASIAAFAFAANAAETVFKEAGGQAVIEAEHFTARTANADGGHWQVVPDEGVPTGGTPIFAHPHGSYINSLPDSPGGGVNHNAATDALNTPPFVDYKVNISTTGDYRLWLRWGGYDGSSDSIYAQILELNTTSPMWYRFSRSINGDFDSAGWDSTAGAEKNDGGPDATDGPAVWTIANPGTYTIRLTQREDGSAVDSMIFQLNSMADPTLPGPSESALSSGFILNSPANAVASPPSPATFTAGAKVAGGAAVTYQWQSKAPGASTFTDIPGATSASYTTPATTTAMSGTQYRVVATSGGTTLTSGAATLTTDNTPPSILHAFSGPANTQVTIQFSEPLDPTSAAATGNFSISGLNITSAKLGIDNKSVILKTSAQTPSTSYTVNVNGVKDVVGNAQTGGTATFKGAVDLPGQLLVRKYENITGTTVANLTSAATYPDQPGLVVYWDAFGGGVTGIFNGNGNNLGDNYGLEITGFVIPDKTADYEFYLSSDDSSALYLSTDETAANATLIAQETSCCHNFTHQPGGLSSAAIHLVQGQRYYVRAYLKEGGGGDFISVDWRNSVDDGDITVAPLGQLESITGPFLASGYDPSVTITITNQPASVSTSQNSPYSFTVGYTAYSPVLGTSATVQWQKAPSGSTTFADIPGATNLTYSQTFASLADNGAKIQAVVTEGTVQVTSTPATLSVSSDTTPPTVVAFLGTRTSGTILFSEPVDSTTAAAASSYSISPSGSISAVNVTSASDGSGEVILTLSGLTNLGTYTVTIKNVKDTANNTMAQVTKTFVAYDVFADFNSAILPGIATAVASAGSAPGTATIYTNTFQLTPNVGSSQGNLIFSNIFPNPDDAVTNFTAIFKLRIGDGSGNPADGFSFNLGSDVPTNGSIGEEGGGSGFTLTLDTYDNGGGEAPALTLKYGGGAVDEIKVPKATLVNNTWVTVIIKVADDGTVSIYHNNVKYFDGDILPGWTPITTPVLVIAGRTGGEFHRNQIDDLKVVYNSDLPFNQPPTISITSPTDGATFAAGATVSGTVDAKDPENQIAKVEFFANGQKLGESTTAPYSFTVPNVPQGVYVLTATVTDGAGAAVTSTPVRIVVGNPPLALVITATAGPNASDQAFINHLVAKGFNPVQVGDTASQTTDADGKAIIVISSSVSSGQVGNKFQTVTNGIFNWENALQDNFLFVPDTANDHNTVAARTDLVIDNPSSPLAAGLTGTITVTSTAQDQSWALATDLTNAIKVASTSEGLGHQAIYAFEKGSILYDGSAAAGRRAHVFMTDNSFASITSDGLKLVDAAIAWLTSPPVAGQPKISYTLSSNLLSITWTNGGSLQEAPAVTGPWVAVSSSGSFTKTIPATSGMNFYRVVRAQ